VNYWTLICTSLWIASFNIAWAEPSLDPKTTYYDVSGASARELRYSINTRRPRYQAHDAHTAWHVSWTYSWRSVEGGVIIAKPKVNVSIATTLPRWTPPKDAEDHLVNRWQTYMKALVLHENGHALLATKAAREIEQKLTALPKQSSVEALKQLIETTAQQVLTATREREKNFDAQTDHGMKQGARFP
jgi:predicted secreted Zn-dependent protease